MPYSSAMRRLPRRIILAPMLAAVTLVLPGGAGAQTQPATPPQSPPPLRLLIAPFYLELAQLRGIGSPGPAPPLELKSREEMRRFIEQEMDRRYSAARVERERKGMVAWGLIPRDYDLRRLFLDLMEEQVAAYYDPRTKAMVVGDWLSSDAQQAALLHELVHALQDREISLEGFLAPHPGHGDRLLARQALIEGEAVGLTLDLLLKAQGASLASLPDLSAVRSGVAAGANGPAIGAAPRFLRDLLIFPYLEGLDFAYQLRKSQPWSDMSSLYKDPPRSTSQIMHPAKRLGAREDPVPVALPDLAALGPGLTVVAEDELGEFALGAVLGLHLGEAAGRAAAAGWRGDRYRVWEDGDGRFAIAYLLVLESAPLADAFARNYARVIAARHPVLAGKAPAAPGGPLLAWQDGDRTFTIERRGPEVLVIEQMPAAVADRARESIWRARGPAVARP